jgi:hypothetical protein
VLNLLRKFRENLSFANVMSVAAVFIALGGSAWALARNSVGPAQIQPDAVTGSEIKENAVRTRHVADGSLLSQDFAPGQLPAGPPGEPGQPGSPGEPGQPGSPGLSGLTISHGLADASTDPIQWETVECPDGQTAIDAGIAYTILPYPQTGHAALSDVLGIGSSQVYVSAIWTGTPGQTWGIQPYVACAYVVP